MALTISDFVQLVQRTDDIQKRKNGVFRFKAITGGSVDLSSAELEAIDHRLPRLLLSELKARYRATLVLRTLIMWDIPDAPRYLDCVVRRIDAIHAVNVNANTVVVDINYFRAKSIRSGIECAVASCREEHKTIDYDWFEQHFPGTATRAVIALTLGLTPQETCAYALATASNDAPVLLPDTLTEYACTSASTPLEMGHAAHR